MVACLEGVCAFVFVVCRRNLSLSSLIIRGPLSSCVSACVVYIHLRPAVTQSALSYSDMCTGICTNRLLVNKT